MASKRGALQVLINREGLVQKTMCAINRFFLHVLNEVEGFDFLERD